MANTPVEVKKAAPAVTNAPDAWRSLRTEMDRMFDRFAGGWGMPSLRRMFDAEPVEELSEISTPEMELPLALVSPPIAPPPSNPLPELPPSANLTAKPDQNLTSTQGLHISLP